MESNHHGCFHPQGPQAEWTPLARAEIGLQSQVRSGCLRLNLAASGAHWRTTGAPGAVSGRVPRIVRPCPLRRVKLLSKSPRSLETLAITRTRTATWTTTKRSESL